MERIIRKKSYFLIKMILIFLIIIGIMSYSARFPVTMKLLDENIDKILKNTGIEMEFDFFEKLSVVSERIINETVFLIEVIKNNLSEKDNNSKPISALLITCSAKFPSESKKISSFFGKREDPFTKKEDIHEGIDIAAAVGSNIFAAWPGNVFETGCDSFYGNFIVLEHSKGFLTKYCHLSKITVKKGNFVNAEEKIGEAGSTGRSTGSHLHFEVLIDGIKIDPMECFEI